MGRRGKASDGQFRASLVRADRAERKLRADNGVHFSEPGYRSIARLAFEAVAAEPLAAAGAALAS